MERWWVSNAQSSSWFALSENISKHYLTITQLIVSEEGFNQRDWCSRIDRTPIRFRVERYSLQETHSARQKTKNVMKISLGIMINENKERKYHGKQTDMRKVMPWYEKWIILDPALPWQNHDPTVHAYRNFTSNTLPTSRHADHSFIVR